MAGKLPTVTQYIKNVGKSVAYAAVDVMKEPTENISGFMEENEDLFKTVYSAAKNYKQTLKYIDRSFKKSRVYDAVSTGWKNVKDDLKTGNWYNKERDAETAGAAMFGDDFMDFSMFENDDIGGFDDISDDDDQGSATAKAAAMQSKASLAGSSMVMDAITQNSRMEANVIASSAEAVGMTIQAGTKIQMMQSEKIYTGVMQGFSGANAGIKMISEILNGPMNKFMNESTKFYEETNKNIVEINAYLKEMTEMQRNLYKQQQTEYKNSAYEQVVGSGGGPNIMAYMKRIYKNVQDLDPTGMLADKDSNVLKMFAGAPLKFIPEMMVKTMLPAVMRETLKTFDESMTGVFSAFIAKMNDWAENETGDGGINFRGLIGKLLGVKIDKKLTLDTTKYNKGPIPFDGETKKAIVDVIPQYLSRIESALTGLPERHYDSKSGSWKNINQINKEFEDIKRRAKESITDDLDETFEKWARRKLQRSSSNPSGEDLEKMKKKFKSEFGASLFDNPHFRPYMGIGPRGERSSDTNPYSGIFGSDEDVVDFFKFARKHNKTALWNLSRNAIEARESASRMISGNEGSVGNMFTRLFDGSVVAIDKHGKFIKYNQGSKYGGNDNSKSMLESKFFKTSNDYLREILGEVRYIRMHGLSGGGGRALRDIGGPNRPDFDAFLASQSDLTIEDRDSEWQDPNKNYSFHRYEEPKQKSELEKYGITPDVAKKFANAKNFEERLEATRAAVSNMLRRPAAMFAGFINKADQRLFDIMFGREDGTTFRDRAGLEYQGLLDYMVIRTGQIFDQFKDKMKAGWTWMIDQIKKTKIGGAAIDKFNELRGSVGDALKSKFAFLRRRGGEALSNTYGAAYNYAANSEGAVGNLLRAINKGVVSAEQAGEILNQNTTLEDEQEAWFERNFGNMARGGRVNKYGLTMVSPGEIIIPNSKDRQGHDLIRENMEKAKILRHLRGMKGVHIGNYAAGTTTGTVVVDEARIADAQRRVNEKKEETLLKKILHETAGKDGDIIADAIIGSGVSLITGMIGGPLLGAAFGTGVGLIKNSKSLQTMMFGEWVNGEQTKEGFIPKKVQDFFKDHSQGMIDFGTAGAVAGLFTPLGLVGGAMAGAALGYAKDTKAFKDFMFGNVEEGKEGLMSEETKAKLKKALPSMLVGGVALGALGPFGFIGNAMLGATAGFVSSTDEFKKFIFGEKDENGKVQGGLIGSIKNGFINPMLDFGKDLLTKGKDYMKKNFLNPLTDFLKGSGMFLRDTISSIAGRVTDGINGIFEKHIGMPIEEWLREKVFKRAAGLITGVGKLLLKPAGAIASAPFKLAGALGNRMTARSIRRGTAIGMNADQRLQWRKEHNIGSGDKTFKLDNMLSKMNVDQLASLNSGLKSFNSGRGAATKRYNELVKEAGGKISDYFGSHGIWDRAKPGVALNAKKYILKKIQEGSIDPQRLANQVLNKYPRLFNDGEVEDLLSNIPLEAIANAQSTAYKESGITKETLDIIQRETGLRNLSKNNSFFGKELGRYVNNELNFKKKLEASKSPEERAQIEGNAAEKHIANTLDKILAAITKTNEFENNYKEGVVAARTSGMLHLDKSGKWVNELGERASNAEIGRFQQEHAAEYAEMIQYHPEAIKATLNKKNRFFKFGRGVGSFFRNKVGGIGSIVSSFGSAYSMGRDVTWGNNAAKYEGLDPDTISKLASGKYRFKENEDGSTTLVDRDGKPAPGAENANKYKEYMKAHEKEIKGRQTFFGAISGWIGDKVGKVGGFVKKIKDKIKLGIQAIGNIPVIGPLLKGVKAVGIIALLGAALGHGVGAIIKVKDWLKDKLGGVISRIWQGEDGNGGIKGFFGNIWDKAKETWPKVFGEEGIIGKPISELRDKITGFADEAKKEGNGSFLKGAAKIIAKGFWDWFKTGWEQNYNYIIKPLGEKLYAIVWHGIHDKDMKDWLAESGGTLKQESAVAQYRDNITGKLTTNQYDASGKENEIEDYGVNLHGVDRGNGFWHYASGLSNSDFGVIRIKYSPVTVGDFKFTKMEMNDGSIVIISDNTNEALQVYKDTGIVRLFSYTKSWLGTHYWSVVQNLTIANNPDRCAELLVRFGFDNGRMDVWQPRKYVYDALDPNPDNGGLSGYAINSEKQRAEEYQQTLKTQAEIANRYTRGGQGRRGRGRQGGIYANMPYGNSTIGDSGCGPIAAVAAMKGRGIPDAAIYAEQGGYVYPDGSTDIGYFGDYFASKGISSYMTTNKNEVMNEIRKGKNAVLLGKDQPGGVYSSNDHYITAIGGRGRLNVYDPELGPRTVSSEAAMKGMKAAVITGSGRSRMNSRYMGKGRYTGRAYDDAGLNTSKILGVAESQIGNGPDKYQRAYGLVDAWCCMFIWWLFQKVNAPELFYGGQKCASCTELYGFFSRQGQIVKGGTENIQPGDLVFYNWKGGSTCNHIGIAYKRGTNNEVYTIEGNTERPSGNGPSYGVYKKTRKAKYVVGAARPRYANANMSNVDVGEASSESAGSGGLLAALMSLGKSMIKAVFGSNLFNALFGSSEANNANSYAQMDDSEALGNYTAYNPSQSANEIWKYLRAKEGFSSIGAAGIMGNFENESNNRADRLEGDYAYASKYGGVNEIMKSRNTLDDYTVNSLFPGYDRSGIKINKTAYKSDGHYYPGIGLAQWTGERGKNLFNFASSNNKDWRDLNTQLAFFSKEMTSRGGRDAVKRASTPEEAAYNFFDTFEMPGKGKSTNSTIVKTLAERKKDARAIYEKYRTARVEGADLRGSGRYDKALKGGYARKVNTNYVNKYSGGARNILGSSTGTNLGGLSYSNFLETIISILMSISTNTTALSKILEILSNKFGINVDTGEVDKAVKLSKTEARRALTNLIQDKNSGETIGNILQNKDTGYIISAMQEIARQ